MWATPAPEPGEPCSRSARRPQNGHRRGVMPNGNTAWPATAFAVRVTEWARRREIRNGRPLPNVLACP